MTLTREQLGLPEYGTAEHRINVSGGTLGSMAGLSSIDTSIGYAKGEVLLYNTPSRVMKLANGQRYREIIDRGTFRLGLLDPKNKVMLYINHDERALLAAKHSGTMRLFDGPASLMYDALIAPTTYGRDLLISAERGDVDGSMSFGMFVDVGGDSIEMLDGLPLRRVRKAVLFDVTISTALAAYSEPRSRIVGLEQAPRETRSLRNRLAVQLSRMEGAR